MSKGNNNPSPNVYGIETEYSCMLTLPGDVVYEVVGGCHSADAALGLFEAPKSNGMSGLCDPDSSLAEALDSMGILKNSAGMLSNGGRLYVDPSGPEYCTPETTTAEEAVHRTFDGDAILVSVFRKMQNKKLLEGFQVNRRVVDHNRSSRGIHLNTLTTIDPDHSESPPITTWLGALNVAKGTIFGSGGLLVDDDGCTAFHHSPRLSVTTDLSANWSNHKLRPLVRGPFKRDEGGTGLARIETVTSDALNFGWPLKASLVVTNAAVHLIELGRGTLMPVINSNRAVESAHNVGQYGSEGIMFIEDRDGCSKGIIAIDVMRGIAEAILQVNEEEGFLDKESSQVMDEVVEVADKMARDPLSVISQVESVARKIAIDRAMAKHEASIESERICRLDYAWDKVGGGLAEIHREKGNFGWLGFSPQVKPSTVKRRFVTPPQNTRARVRGAFIEAQGGTDDSCWDKIDFGEETKPLHPLATSIPVDVHIPDSLKSEPAVVKLG